MIGKIIGIFSGYYNNIAVIDIQSNDCSIGYEISMKKSDILSMKRGNRYTIFIKEIIKEDDDSLYGFLSFEEKCWFEEFIKLSGLGAKIALSILSTFSCKAISESIMANNCDFFSSISGIGSKLANRIPNEMRKNSEKINERVIEYGELNNDNNSSDNFLDDNKTNQEIISKNNLYNIDIRSNQNNIKKNDDKKTKVDKNTNNKENKTEIINDAVNALAVLGFSKNNIYNDVFAIIKKDNSLTTEEIVKQFLKQKDK